MFDWNSLKNALVGGTNPAQQEWPLRMSVPGGGGANVPIQQPQQGLLGSLGSYINNNPNQAAIMLDMMGSKIAPDNAFAGIGQHMGSSAIASEAANKQNERQQSFLEQLLKALSGKDTEGPTSITITGDPNGGPPQINLKATGLGNLMNSTNAPGNGLPTNRTNPVIPQSSQPKPIDFGR